MEHHLSQTPFRHLPFRQAGPRPPWQPIPAPLLLQPGDPFQSIPAWSSSTSPNSLSPQDLWWISRVRRAIFHFSALNDISYPLACLWATCALVWSASRLISENQKLMLSPILPLPPSPLHPEPAQCLGHADHQLLLGWALGVQLAQRSPEIQGTCLGQLQKSCPAVLKSYSQRRWRLSCLQAGRFGDGMQRWLGCQPSPEVIINP